MAFVNPFGNQNTDNTSSGNTGGFKNPFAGYNPNPPQPKADYTAPKNQVLPPEPQQSFSQGIDNFFSGAGKAISGTVSNIESNPTVQKVSQFLSPIRDKVGSVLEDQINKALGGVTGGVDYTPTLNKVNSKLNPSGEQTLLSPGEKFTGNPITDISKVILDNLNAFIPMGAGAAAETFSASKAATSAAFQAALQIFAGQKPSEVVKNLPFGLLGGLDMKEEPLKLTPEQARNEVVTTDLANTALGKEIVKNSFEAEQTNQHVQLSYDPESNLKTVTDFPVKVEVVPSDQELISNYRNANPDKLLNADDVREVYTPQGYNRANSADFHERSSALTKQIFQEDIANLKPGDKYLFTAGSSGAGKSVTLAANPDLLKGLAGGLDGNFSSESSIAKLGQVIDKGADPTIVFVNRDPIDAWRNGVVRRAVNPENGRVVPLETFLKNLEDSPKRVLEAHQKFGDKVQIQVLDNNKPNPEPEQNPVAFLQGIKYNIDDVRQQIISSTEKQLRDKTITPSLFQQLIGKENGLKSNQELTGNQGRNNETPSLALSVKQTSIEKKLTSDLKDLPTYEKMDMKDQASRATNLLKSDPQRAMDIATGKEEAPKGLRAESVFKAVESSITTPAQAIELAHSPLVSQATEMGQRIKALDTKAVESPVEAMKRVIDARADALKEKTGQTVNEAIKSTIKDIKSTVEQTTPKKGDIASFIKSIQC